MNLLYSFLASNNLLIQELFRLNLNEKGVLPPSPSSHHHHHHHHHHPNTFHTNRDIKRNESLISHASKSYQQSTRTLPEKTAGNTFERTSGTAMRTVAFHFKVSSMIGFVVSLERNGIRRIHDEHDRARMYLVEQ
jgi:hypothetical protein